MSLVEIGVGAEGGGVSALRTFRLLRIFKLARSWKSLQVRRLTRYSYSY